MTAVELVSGWISMLADGFQFGLIPSEPSAGFVVGLYSGAMIALGLSVAALATWRPRNRPLLWFAGAALVAGAWNAMAQAQLQSAGAWPAIPLAIAVFVALLLRHAQLALQTQSQSPALHRQLRSLFYVAGGVALITALWSSVAWLFSTALLVTACLLLMAGSLRRLREQQDSHAVAPLMASVLLLMASVPHAAINFGLSLPPTAAFWVNALQLALALSVFTLGVSVLALLDVGALHRSAVRKTHGVTLDEVTLLPDRAGFLQSIEDRIRSQGTEAPFAVISIGIPELRTLVHDLDAEQADAALSELTQRLRTVIEPGDLLARVHPERFAWLTSVTPPAGLLDLQGRCIYLRRELGLPLAQGDGVALNCNFGIATFPEHGHDGQLLLRRSDEALYRAEKAGPGQISVFNIKMQEHAHHQATLTRALREALTRDQLELHYQPLLDLQTGDLRGLEALLRWRRDGKMIPPNEFIPLAEASDLIIDLGEWVMRRACQQARQWHAAGIKVPSIAVNVSPSQFRHTQFTSQVVRALQEAGSSDTQLALEITENVVLDDIDGTRLLLQQLAERGIHASVDDFGVGYSSLSYLRKLPVKAVKIDRSFLNGIPDEPEAVSIIATIISLGRDLGLQVIAEGIETEEQHSFLSQRGVRFGQGFLLSKPLPPLDLERWITARTPLLTPA